MESVPARRHYVAIFVLSLCLLTLEIAFSRMLAVALFSHYAFVAISLAMFGLGLSALIVYLAPERFSRPRLDHQLTTNLALLAVSAAGSCWLFLQFRVVQELSISGFLTLSFAYGLLALPFLFGGVCVALLMKHFAADIGRIYFADLVGASFGCLGVVLLMNLIPAPDISLVVASLAVASSLFMGVAARPRKLLGPTVSLVVIGSLIILAATTDSFRMRYVKNWSTFYSDYEAWNAFSRVSAFDVEQNAAQIVPLKGPPSAYQKGDYPASMMLDIDGAAWTPMMNFDGDLASIRFLRDSVLYAAHRIRKNTDVLVIGTGGGRDLLAALASRQRSVQGIELNPLMYHIVEERYGAYSGHPYTREGVNVVIDEARSRLHRMKRKFGIVQLSLIDTFSLNAAGGFVFSENNLYTREAFEEYFNHLTDDGVLSLTRYFVSQYPVEILRLLVLVREAWAAQGVDSVADRVLVLSRGLNATVLAKRTSYTKPELARIDRFAAENGIAVLYRPGKVTGHSEIRSVITTRDLGRYVASYKFLIDSPTDDRPFFFNFLRHRLTEVPDVHGDPLQFMRLWDDALALMYLLITVVTVLAVLFFLGPLLLLSRRGIEGAPVGYTTKFLLYFACLGYGFMMIEIPVMQRLILFLGYPVYALSVVLFSLLLFSGIGSLLTTRFRDAGQAVRWTLGGIVGVSLVYAYFLPQVIDSLLGVTVFVKIVVTVVMLAPIGLLMGTAYPLGIGLLCEFRESLVPWAWGLNGAFSVVASVLATVLGSRLGFTFAMITGVASYGIALGCITMVSGRRRVGLREDSSQTALA